MEIESLYTADLHERGAEMQVNDQYGKPLELYLSVVGVDSKAWRKESMELRRATFQGDDAEDARAECMAICTLGWRGFESNG